MTTQQQIDNAKAVLRLTGPIPYTDEAIDALETLIGIASDAPGSARGMIRSNIRIGLHFETAVRRNNGQTVIRAASG